MVYHNLILPLFLSITRIFGANHEDFAQCMFSLTGYSSTTEYLFGPSSSLYSILLQSAEQNPRWLNSTAPKPLFIITPNREAQIQAAIMCSKKNGLQIRVKSGGHDYEGLSYLCKTPFVIIDLINLRSVNVDMEEETAWVQSGATLGELYYNIAQKSKVHGFPAGLCPSVGVGGHFSGGGFGTMLRKHGLAADNIIDACVIDGNGRILNRQTMDEDLFWAIRGGGGASFGVIVSWKIKLVRVPPAVTVFTISRKLDTEGTTLVHKWQFIASKLPRDLFIRIIVQNDSKGQQKQVVALFNSLFLGPINDLIPLMNKNFPKLGLQEKECSEMSWIQSILYFAGYQKEQPLGVLLDRIVQYKSYFKAKSDFVLQPIPESAIGGIWERIIEEETVYMIMDPFGGRMDEIPEYELPFPHRKGNLYNIQYMVKWKADSKTESQKHINWIRMLHMYMKPYVSHNPRAAYLNYRDLDLGVNKQEHARYYEAMIWGSKYFKGNFRRLALVKTKVDPENFFRNEQSLPLLKH